jgi:hypothetical protein
MQSAHASPHAHVHDYSERSHPEAVVLDIGGPYGALIVETDAQMHGVEVEISPTDGQRDGRHKQVLERRIGERSAYTLVFDKLSEGTYTLWVGDQARARDVRISASRLTELDWR